MTDFVGLEVWHQVSVIRREKLTARLGHGKKHDEFGDSADPCTLSLGRVGNRPDGEMLGWFQSHHSEAEAAFEELVSIDSSVGFARMSFEQLGFPWPHRGVLDYTCGSRFRRDPP